MFRTWIVSYFLLVATATVLAQPSRSPASKPAAPAKPFPTDHEQSTVTELLTQKHYKEAEAKIAALLGTREPTLNLLIWRDISLNGQGKFKEADAAKEGLLGHWNKYFHRSWLERGQPKSEGTWPRLELYEKTRVIQACEYFVPELVGPADGPHAINYFKFIVLEAEGQPRGLYKLEMSNLGEPLYVLANIEEDGRRQVKRYGDRKPDIWTVLKDVQADIAQLEKEDWR